MKGPVRNLECRHRCHCVPTSAGRSPAPLFAEILVRCQIRRSTGVMLPCERHERTLEQFRRERDPTVLIVDAAFAVQLEHRLRLFCPPTRAAFVHASPSVASTRLNDGIPGRSTGGKYVPPQNGSPLSASVRRSWANRPGPPSPEPLACRSSRRPGALRDRPSR